MGSVQPTKAQACSQQANTHRSVSRVFLNRAPIPKLESKEVEEVPQDIFSMNPLFSNTP